MEQVTVEQVRRGGRLGLCVLGILSFLHPACLRGTETAQDPSLGNRGTKRPLTVADAIESTQVLYDHGGTPVQVSPDGRRYLVVLYHGDVSRNGSWVELLSGWTTSLGKASKPHALAQLFSKSSAQTTELIRNVHWLGDSERLTFLWDDGQRPSQIVELNVRTRQLRTLTRHPSSIVKYDISADGKTIIFTAMTPRDPSKTIEMRQAGFAVADQSIWSLIEGNIDGWTPWLHYETFVSMASGNRPHKVLEPTHVWSTPPELLRLSPNGRYAIAVRPVDDVPATWAKYTEPTFRDIYFPAARQHPGRPNWVRQYVVIDVAHHLARPLWNAPENPHGRVVWLPDSRSIVVGPTFLPPGNPDALGVAGISTVEVNIAAGAYASLPVPTKLSEKGYRPLHMREDGVVEISPVAAKPGLTNLRFDKIGGAWHLMGGDFSKDLPLASVQIELRQNLNDPPRLYAVESSSGREKLVRDLNPRLTTDVTVGHVELVHWKATDGRPWSGVLYYPVQYEAGRRFPLVFQTHGYTPGSFSLDGAFTTAFAAQPLANRDIAVLQIGAPDAVEGEKDNLLMTSQGLGMFVAGCEGAIEHFATTGLVDREKVGIIGFSATGLFVEYLLTHSEGSITAALVADNMDGGYFQYTLVDSGLRAFFEAEIGAAPFGKGLEVWMRETPGFNADRVRTPLRMEIDSGPIDEILLQWEMFTNLRYLRKPVELFVIPNIEHGAHILQNPAQRMASQGGSVDWFCFWLKGEEDPDPSKAGQYVRWRELRTLQTQNGIAAPGAAITRKREDNEAEGRPSGTGRPPP